MAVEDVLQRHLEACALGAECEGLVRVVLPVPVQIEHQHVVGTERAGRARHGQELRLAGASRTAAPRAPPGRWCRPRRATAASRRAPSPAAPASRSGAACPGRDPARRRRLPRRARSGPVPGTRESPRGPRRGAPLQPARPPPGSQGRSWRPGCASAAVAWVRAPAARPRRADRRLASARPRSSPRSPPRSLPSCHSRAGVRGHSRPRCRARGCSRASARRTRRPAA